VAIDSLAFSNDDKTLYCQPHRPLALPHRHRAPDVGRSGDRRRENAGASYVADGLLMTRDGRLLITSPEESSIKL
jgi:hypothetical protein